MNDETWFDVGICVLILILFLTFGCASAPPSLSITEAEIDAKLEALSSPPKDPGAVVYNATEDTYELRPDVFKRALRDGVVKGIQDEKFKAMNDYLAEHPPITFWDKVKLFGIGYILGVITGAAGGIYISQ